MAFKVRTGSGREEKESRSNNEVMIMMSFADMRCVLIDQIYKK